MSQQTSASLRTSAISSQKGIDDSPEPAHSPFHNPVQSASGRVKNIKDFVHSLFGVEGRVDLTGLSQYVVGWIVWMNKMGRVVLLVFTALFILLYMLCIVYLELGRGAIIN